MIIYFERQARPVFASCISVMKDPENEIAATAVASFSKKPELAEQQAFDEILTLIQNAKQRAYQAVNGELVNLYWQVGEYISGKLKSAAWGDGVVAELARFLAPTQPSLRGFTRASLFRMRQFFDAYNGDAIVAALLRQLPWTHHLLILGRCKRPEEREFYLRLASRERWPSRELRRQIECGLFERAVMNPPKVATALRQMHPEVASIFKDVYTLEFLTCPPAIPKRTSKVHC